MGVAEAIMRRILGRAWRMEEGAVVLVGEGVEGFRLVEEGGD